MEKLISETLKKAVGFIERMTSILITEQNPENDYVDQGRMGA